MSHPWLVKVATVLFIAVGATASHGQTRPALPEGVPDLTAGEVEREGKDWFLHCGGARGWVWRDELGSADKARQIYVTKVPATSPVRDKLKVGDVILGVNGKYFSKHAVYEFREASLPAGRNHERFDVILWRKGWDKQRSITLDLTFKPLDFTRGDKPGLETDWNLGPTGARGYIQGLNHESFISRQILITAVEGGSPADGILQKGDVILGIGSRKFDSDARRALGEAITQAETKAGGGKLNLLRWRPFDGAQGEGGKTETVTVPLKVLGSYSKTTPWECDKSKAILKAAGDYIVRNDILHQRPTMHCATQVAALALMSTGDPAHMKLAKGHIDRLVELTAESGPFPPIHVYSSWDWGYANLALCEYYLLTRDESVLATIRKFSEAMARGQSGAGTWGHRMAFPNHGPCHGYGALNQAGNMCLMSLALAKRCGVTSDSIERALAEGSSFLAQFVDLQPIPYGDHPNLDPTGHDDNGKCSQAAVIFAITGEKRPARFYSRMTVASHAVRERGHTGNWWSFLWGPLGAARAGQPAASAFLHEQTWYFDLERRCDGGFTYQGKMNTGYGVNEDGRQKGGSEHTTGHWDTTICRALMYALPHQRLAITGKGVMTTRQSDRHIQMLIAAGQRPAKDHQRFEQMYDDRGVDELRKLLGHWSPVVRNFAALSLAKQEGDHTPKLINLLDGGNRYARYGACSAMRRLGGGASRAVGPLIVKLNDPDPLLRIHASAALGAIGDERAVEPLLRLIAGEIDNDPRDMVRRLAARALFFRDGLLHDSIDGVDRELLFAATRKLLEGKGGQVRSAVATAVLDKLTMDEMQELWPAAIPALRVVAPTEIMFASGVRETVAKMLADNRIEEGMELILDYMKNQKPHGSGGRNEKIMGWLASYGASAKPILPKLEAYLAFLEAEKDKPWVDKGQPPWARFYAGQIPHVTAAIESIRNATETPELISIAEYLQAE